MRDTADVLMPDLVKFIIIVFIQLLDSHPSRMAISRSHPRHLVKFREKRKEKKNAFYLLFLKKDAAFYNSHIFTIPIFFSFKKTHFLFIHIICLIIRPVICPVIRLVICQFI